nr:MAG TPA: hypothetical protein [Caudoviricetes sp.]
MITLHGPCRHKMGVGGGRMVMQAKEPISKSIAE